MLAPSTVNIRFVIPANIESQPNIGSHPCGKPCVYSTLLRKSEAETFQSLSNGQSFKIRQRINCQLSNLIYLVTCHICNLQGVGRAIKFSTRMANCFSHIKQKKKNCAIGNHFLDNHLGVWEESYKLNETFDIKGIAMLTNVPSNPKQKTRIN